MGRRDIIVMGASAGGTETCCAILEVLPSNLPASVLIVQHVGRTSVLAEVLRRCCALKVDDASDGQAIRRGRAYVAPGDHHLRLQDGKIRLSRGPRENRQRPSVDVLFRSAARLRPAGIADVARQFGRRWLAPGSRRSLCSDATFQVPQRSGDGAGPETPGWRCLVFADAVNRVQEERGGGTTGNKPEGEPRTKT